MTKKPEPAPDSDPSEKTISIWLDREKHPALQTLLMRANAHYLYWDKFKYLTPPEGLQIDEAWRVLRMERLLISQKTPILDVNGRHFSYSPVDALQRSLMVIDQQAGGRIGTRVFEFSRETQRAYVLNRLMEEAIASSQIEGAATTRRDAKEMLRVGRKPQTRGERMILNNYYTIKRIHEFLDRPLTPQLLLDLQGSLTEGTLADPSEGGRFRTPADDDIIVGDFTGTVFHVPPKAVDIALHIDLLCRFANEEGDHFVHPVLKAVLLHFWLAYLHPFCDGNGRTARAVFYLQSLKAGYWPFEYVSISRVILRRRAQYEKAFLYSEADSADVTYFAAFHLKAIEKALDEFWEYAERKVREDTELQQRVSVDAEFNYRQRALLTRALKDSASVFTIESHRASHGIAYATARSDLLQLVEGGHLTKRRRGRSFVFMPVPNLRDRLGAAQSDSSLPALP